MNPTLDNIRERVAQKVAQYLDELGPQLMEHRQQGRAVRFSLSATIDDDPNQSTLGV